MVDRDELAASVCVPCYNGAASIAQCIESVRAQPVFREGKVELVVVDDGSSDGTRDLLEGYRGDRVRVVFNDARLGLTANWQKALSLGRGRIVTLLHQDDWHDPDCIAAAVGAFDAHPGAALVAFGQVHHGDREKAAPRKEVGVFSGRAYFNRRLSFQDCPAPSTVFLRREYLAGMVPHFDAAFRFCAELDLFMRLAAAYPEAAFIHDARLLVHRGRSDGQFSQRFSGYRILDTCLVLARYQPPEREGDVRRMARVSSRRLIARDLEHLLRIRDGRQLRMVLRNPLFLRWLLGAPGNVRVLFNASRSHFQRKLRQ